MKEYIDSSDYKGPDKITVEYKNLEQFIADISTKDYPRNSSESENEKWSGSESVETAIEEAREGLNLGEVDLGIVRNEQLHDYINRATYSVAGGTVDIGKFLTGEPECMIDFQTEDAMRFVTLNADICEHCGIGSAIFKRKSIAIACLVDELENNGFRVKLNVCCNIDFSSRSGGRLKRLIGMVTVKDYQQKLSIAQITGCVSQGFFRRLMFCFIEKYTPFDPDPGYGRPGDDYKDIEGVILKNTENGMPLNNEADIKKYVEKYTTDIYQLSTI